MALGRPRPLEVLLRGELPPDAPRVRQVLLAAFPTNAEADLVDALRVSEAPSIALVACTGSAVVGCILFTPVSLQRSASEVANAPVLYGLAPMAVQPDEQNRGVGSRLVREGLDACRTRGVDAVVVLGHPAYYPRFGFRPASEFALSSTYDVPDDVFMAQELVPDSLAGVAGTLHFHPAFESV